MSEPAEQPTPTPDRTRPATPTVDGPRWRNEGLRKKPRRLRDHRAQLDRMVEQLLRHETLDDARVYVAAGIGRLARVAAVGVTS